MCSTPTPFVASEPIKIGHYFPTKKIKSSRSGCFCWLASRSAGVQSNMFVQVAEPVDLGPINIRGFNGRWLKSELCVAISRW